MKHDHELPAFSKGFVTEIHIDQLLNNVASPRITDIDEALSTLNEYTSPGQGDHAIAIVTHLDVGQIDRPARGLIPYTEEDALAGYSNEIRPISKL